MKPQRIILIRHGQSQGNVDHSVHSRIPDHKLSLTALGHDQAFESGKKIVELIGNESVAVYSSPYMRTRETLLGIQKSGMNIVSSFEEPRIREQEWGNFRDPADTERHQKIRYAYGTFFYRFPDGESGADVYDRVSTFLETLHRDFKKPTYPNNTLIVTHGLTIRLFIMRWFHQDVETFEKWDNPKNCQFFVMEKTEGEKNSRYKLVTPLEFEKNS